MRSCQCRVHSTQFSRRKERIAFLKLVSLDIRHLNCRGLVGLLEMQTLGPPQPLGEKISPVLQN